MKRRAGPRLGFEPHRAAVSFGDPLDDREPDAGPLTVSDITALEELEDLVVERRCDPHVE